MALLLTACRPADAPVSAPRYVVGAPYQAGGLWSYPSTAWPEAETGAAEVLPARTGLTANGSLADSSRAWAAHRTLPLPSVVTVTNLEHGLQLRLAVIERGPERAGRVLGLSARAAALLGVDGAAPVRVEVDRAASLAMAQGLPGWGADAPAATAAPRGAVAREALAPLPGSRAAATEVGAPRAAEAPTEAAAAEALPEVVRRVAPEATRWVLEAGTFFRRDLAARQAARLAGGAVEQRGVGRGATYRVRAGPFGTLAEADRALAAALATGLMEIALHAE